MELPVKISEDFVREFTSPTNVLKLTFIEGHVDDLVDDIFKIWYDSSNFQYHLRSILWPICSTENFRTLQRKLKESIKDGYFLSEMKLWNIRSTEEEPEPEKIVPEIETTGYLIHGEFNGKEEYFNISEEEWRQRRQIVNQLVDQLPFDLSESDDPDEDEESDGWEMNNPHADWIEQWEYLIYDNFDENSWVWLFYQDQIPDYFTNLPKFLDAAIVIEVDGDFYTKPTTLEF